MPTVDELIAENGALRKTISAQGIVMHQQRETIKRVTGTKVALVAGRFAAEVDPNAEAIKAAQFTIPPTEIFAKMLAALDFYARPGNYRTAGVPALNSPVMVDQGLKARDFVKSIGR